MIFGKEQIEEVLRIIDFNHTLFIGVNVGVDILTDEDRALLRRYGINTAEIRSDFTPFEQQFYFGRLAAALGDQNASKLDYNDFTKYLKRGQYIPLSQREKETLYFAKQRTYGHIKNLGQKVSQTVNGYIVEEDQALRDAYEATVKGSIERAVVERNAANGIVSEIGEKTGDWGRDLGRIAETEMQTVCEEGRAATIEKEEGRSAEVWKEVYPGACRFCIQFYTTGGIGSAPRVFKLSDLRANGTNIGKKQRDWKPVVSATHPFCRCQLNHKKPGYVWDKELNMFVAPEKEKGKEKKGIKVRVGDKSFEI